MQYGTPAQSCTENHEHTVWCEPFIRMWYNYSGGWTTYVPDVAAYNERTWEKALTAALFHQQFGYKGQRIMVLPYY